MVKSQLIKIITKKHVHLSLYQAERIVDVFFEQIAEALANGGRVELRGFGVFYTKERAPRQAMNPRTHAKIEIEAKLVSCFRASKNLLKTLNEQ